MLAARIRGVLAFIALAVAAACGSSEPAGPASGAPSAIGRISGNGQVGLVGQPLSLPLVVKVTGSGGTPIKGSSVTFAVTSGAASLSPTTTTTDSLGQAKTQVTLGSAAGDVTIISQGVKPGEQVVTDGQLRLNTGTKVQIKPPTGGDQQRPG